MSKQQQQSVFQKFCTAPFSSQHQNSLTHPDEPIEIQERMLKNLSGIHQFGHDTSYYVQDKSRNGWAVHVKLSGRGDVSCDTTCLRWAAYKLCSHTIAVVKKEAVLVNFLKKFAKASREPNLTSLAVHDMPKGRGKTATKATQRRKGRGGTRGAVRT